MQEVKYNYQNIMISFAGNKAHIENRNLFTNTNEYIGILTIECLGELVAEDEIRIDCQPLESVDYPVELDLPNDNEYVVTLSFVLPEDTLWAKAGHEIAFGQTTIGEFRVPMKKATSLTPMTTM